MQETSELITAVLHPEERTWVAFLAIPAFVSVPARVQFIDFTPDFVYKYCSLYFLGQIGK